MTGFCPCKIWTRFQIHGRDSPWTAAWRWRWSCCLWAQGSINFTVSKNKYIISTCSDVVAKVLHNSCKWGCGRVWFDHIYSHVKWDSAHAWHHLSCLCITQNNVPSVLVGFSCHFVDTFYRTNNGLQIVHFITKKHDIWTGQGCADFISPLYIFFLNIVSHRCRWHICRRDGDKLFHWKYSRWFNNSGIYCPLINTCQI